MFSCTCLDKYLFLAVRPIAAATWQDAAVPILSLLSWEEAALVLAFCLFVGSVTI